MAKRGENIYKREDGRWEGRYAKGHRPDGKLAYGYVYARKYGNCKEKLDQAKARYRYVVIMWLSINNAFLTFLGILVFQINLLVLHSYFNE